MSRKTAEPRFNRIVSLDFGNKASRLYDFLDIADFFLQSGRVKISYDNYRGKLPH